jgi:hypothetical protein
MFMRDTRLTLWPEQVAYYPLVNSWADIKQSSVLDLSQCVEIHSCGLAASCLIINWLFKRLNNRDNIDNKRQSIQLHILGEDFIKEKQNKIYTTPIYISEIIHHKNINIMQSCYRLSFFECIKKNIQEKFYDKFINKENKIEPISNGQTLSFPIYMIDYDKYKLRSRDMLDDFFEYSSKIFDCIFEKNIDKGNQLNHILDEIIKNIADHARSDAFIGIDYFTTSYKKYLSILVGDSGPGIYTHMREHLISSNSKRQGKSGFAEVYRYALANEISGSQNPENYGCGMSTIINNCLAIGAQLSVFDQASRLVLSSLSPIENSLLSHNEIWRSSFRIDGVKPFFYFIQCEV